MATFFWGKIDIFGIIYPSMLGRGDLPTLTALLENITDTLASLDTFGRRSFNLTSLFTLSV